MITVYDAFGSLLRGRNFSSSSYRFGLNGQEKDDEVYGAELLPRYSRNECSEISDSGAVVTGPWSWW